MPGENATFTLDGGFSTTAGGIVSQIGNTTVTTHRDVGTWYAIYGVDGANGIRVLVGGEAGKTINWRAAVLPEESD